VDIFNFSLLAMIACIITHNDQNININASDLFIQLSCMNKIKIEAGSKRHEKTLETLAMTREAQVKKLEAEAERIRAETENKFFCQIIGSSV
jgi:hypothetical protein